MDLKTPEKESSPDIGLLENLDLLLEMDVLLEESSWEIIENGGLKDEKQ